MIRHDLDGHDKQVLIPAIGMCRLRKACAKFASPWAFVSDQTSFLAASSAFTIGRQGSNRFECSGSFQARAGWLPAMCVCKARATPSRRTLARREHSRFHPGWLRRRRR